MVRDPVHLSANPTDREKPREGTFSRIMLDALLDGDTFTGPEACKRWDVWSVASLIAGLRAQGWQIDSRRDVYGRNRYYIAKNRRRRLRNATYYPEYRLGV